MVSQPPRPFQLPFLIQLDPVAARYSPCNLRDVIDGTQGPDRQRHAMCDIAALRFGISEEPQLS